MKRPFAALVLVQIGGIIMAYYNVPLWMLAVFAGMLLLLPFVYDDISKLFSVMLIMFFCMGVICTEINQREQNVIAQYVDTTVTIQGKVKSVPDTDDTRTALEIKLSQINDSPVKGKMRMTLETPETIIPVGSTVEATGKLRDFDEKRNPGGFNAALYYQGRHLMGTMWTEEYTIQEEGLSLTNISGRMNQYLSALYDRAFDTNTAALIKGMVLGDDSMGEAAAEWFRKVGVAHILAVSGLHTGYIGMMMLYVLRKLKVPRRYHLLFLGTGLLFYAALTGFSVSVIRASVMMLLLLFSQYTHSGYDALSAVSAAAFCVLLFSPTQLFSAGFQLSFGAVISIVLFYRPFRFYLKKKTKIQNMVSDSLLLTVSATIGTLPVMLYHFHSFNAISLIANLLIVPLFGVLLISGILVLPFLVLVGPEAGLPVTFLAEGILGLTRFFSQFDLFAFNRGALNVFEIAVLFFAALLLAGYFSLKQRWTKTVVIIGLSCSMCVLTVNLLFPRNLKITFLDVGQGDSALIETPSGGAYLIDGGGYEDNGFMDLSERKPISEAVLLPALYDKNIQKLHGVFITHNHEDHAQGIEELAEKIPIDRFYVSTKYNDPDLLEQYQMTQIGAGDVLKTGDGIVIEVLWPEKAIEMEEEDEQNEQSLIMRIRYGETAFLFTGDAGDECEQKLLDASLESNVLKVGHHGSKYATSKAFLEKIKPDAGVISVGKDNGFGHPSDEVIDRLASVNAQVFRTDIQGAIEMISDGKTIEIRTFLE